MECKSRSFTPLTPRTFVRGAPRRSVQDDTSEIWLDAPRRSVQDDTSEIWQAAPRCRVQDDSAVGLLVSRIQ